ncbi:hypothetical protein WI80_33400 [Burkholderia ubonensis]|uniref:glycosyl hydrolase family 28-related protein n=1 Tax=Burkholderia ubonensis TaxID=101571 RepID=UPI000752F706|nr:glycosyl hydrolase family 28-related protein [Burkholderia ubonensis]KVD19193.1 hypothetical protein WI80_33400 [Burkholderia ubonensis]KVU12672.1 hypothetical protein WK63_19430 [Burkholderia ubonensis]
MSILTRNIFVRLASAAGASLIGFLSDAAGAVLVKVASILGLVNRLTDFGADPTGATDSTAAVRAWIAYGMASGKRSHAPSGTYKVVNQIVMDFSNAATSGVTFTGDGIARTVFDCTAVAAAPVWQITDSSGNGQKAFYPEISGIGVKANVGGVAVAIGLNSLADQLNELQVKMAAWNANATASACAFEVNGVFNSDLFLVGNCNGHGDALRVREMQFSRLFGSFGNADTAMHLTGGYVYGNTFSALDLEVVNRCVLIDGANVSKNTWLGGQFVWSNGSGPAVSAIDSTAGNNHRFIGCNFGSPGALVANATGVIVDSAGYGAPIMGGLNIMPVSGDADAVLDSVAGNSALTIFRKAGVTQWASGRDTAGNYIVARYSAAGALIDQPLWIEPTQGVVTLNKASLTGVGFFGAGVITTRPTITGSRGTETAAAASTRAALVSLGLVNDQTTA